MAAVRETAEPRPTPRISPLEPPYAPEIEAMLRKWMPPGSALEPLTLFRVLGVHDDLFARMRPLGAGILGHGRVHPRDREIMILRTCARCGAEYEWGVHAVAFAAQVGLSEAQVEATADGRFDAPVWSDQDSLLIRLADQLHDRCDVSDGVFDALAVRYSPDQLLELVITAGWYRLLSGVIHAARLPREPWAAAFPDQDPHRPQMSAGARGNAASAASRSACENSGSSSLPAK